MTGLLNDVMRERADAAVGPFLDVDAIVRAGERRVRHRRVAGGVAVAAVAGAVAVGGILLPGPVDHDATPAPTTRPFESRQLSWAQGSVVHWGAKTFDLGRKPASYAQTDDGFVYTTQDGTVWFHDGGSGVRLGTADGGRLVTDDEGSLVAWTEPGHGDQPERFVVHDTSTGETVAEVPSEIPLEAGEAGRVMALDDGAAYWRQGDRILRYDVASAREEVLWRQPSSDPSDRDHLAIWQVEDVADGQIAYFVERQEDWGLAVGARIDPRAAVLTAASNGVLSPSGRYLVSEQDDFIAVHDTRTGADVSPDLSRYPYAVGYAWVDDDTVMAYGITSLDGDGPYPVEMLTCEVGGGCTVAGRLEVTETSLALPVGEPLS